MRTSTFLTDKCQVEAYRDCSLLYNSIAARVGLDSMTGRSLIRKLFGCCPGLRVHQISSQIENVRLIVAERLACHHTPVTTVDGLWHRVGAAWASVPVLAFQSLFDSMPRCTNSCYYCQNIMIPTHGSTKIPPKAGLSPSPPGYRGHHESW
ncbi:hypothetical protein TNCV_1956621 [Trichonephila clavipes]|nr:hypothetical protein TNCV_1956621 [Trichonephila clavipes]